MPGTILTKSNSMTREKDQNPLISRILTFLIAMYGDGGSRTPFPLILISTNICFLLLSSLKFLTTVLTTTLFFIENPGYFINSRNSNFNMLSFLGYTYYLLIKNSVIKYTKKNIRSIYKIRS